MGLVLLGTVTVYREFDHGAVEALGVGSDFK